MNHGLAFNLAGMGNHILPKEEEAFRHIEVIDITAEDNDGISEEGSGIPTQNGLNFEPTAFSSSALDIIRLVNSIRALRGELPNGSFLLSPPEDDPNKCSLCGNTYTQKSHLKRHILTHLKIKPYTCTRCGASFTQKGTLKTHLLAHLNIKPFECSECGSSFTRKSGLTRHMQIHSNSKPYKCSHCESSFSNKSDMNRHNNIHLNIKPYECGICQSSFFDKRTLRRHLHRCAFKC